MRKPEIENSISLCLLAFNEEKNIRSFLKQVETQTLFGKELFEVIFVDNGSTDLTLEIINLWIANHPKINSAIFKNSHNNIGSGRALGVQQCQGKFIAFTDPDCSLKPDWLEGLLRQWQKHAPTLKKLGGVGSGNRLPQNTKFSRSINIMLDSFWGHGLSPQAWIPSQATNVAHLATTNALFLRSAVVTAGNFSEHFPTVCEDVDLGLRLRNKNYELLLTPTPIVENRSAHNWTQWFTRMFKFSQGQKAISKTHKKTHPTLPSVVSKLGLLIFIASLIFSFWQPTLLSIPVFYFLFIVIISTLLCLSKKQIHLTPYLFLSFVVTHFGYGYGGCSIRK